MTEKDEKTDVTRVISGILGDKLARTKSGVKSLFAKTGILIVFAIAMASAIGAIATLSTTTRFSNTGSMKAINVEVYSDSGCSNSLTEVDWGTLEPNSTTTRTVYVKNSGNAELTLSMTTSNWSPENATDYMGLTWDKEGATLGAGESVAATLTLTVDGSISGIESFSFDIVIEGTG